MTSPAKALEKQQPYDGLLPDNTEAINNWIEQMKQWELEQTIRDPEFDINQALAEYYNGCLLYTSPSPRDATLSRMPSSA